MKILFFAGKIVEYQQFHMVQPNRRPPGKTKQKHNCSDWWWSRSIDEISEKCMRTTV
jgi:hypothetical protein